MEWRWNGAEETFSAFLGERDMAERECSFKNHTIEMGFCEILVLIIYMYVYSHSFIVP